MNNKKIYLDDTYKLDCEKKINYLEYISEGKTDTVVDSYTSTNMSGTPTNRTYIRIYTSGDNTRTVHFKLISRSK